ncbi:MAG: radical SAM protein [Candidatus Omnitrophota bacterium]
MKLIVKNSNLRPRYFALQWHLTERCNWHCQHCYQEENHTKKELPLQDLVNIFRQYLRLIKYFGTLGPARTRLVLTGGEPLLRDDLFLFLEKIYKYNKYYSLALLSNGSLITDDNAARLKALGVKIFQVSLEGLEENNDAIRGKGAFQKTIKAIEILVKLKVNVVVCLTLTENNISDVPKLVCLCEKIGVSQLGLRRFVTIGRADGIKDCFLTPSRLKKFYLYLEQERKRLQKRKSKLRLIGGCDESIFCQELKRPLINCGVTEGRILTVLSDGQVVPCRRLPIKVGNALENNLRHIYYTSGKLKQLRNLNNIFKPCQECSYFDNCLSGARCISYAYFGRFSSPDPQCWKMFKSLPDPKLLRNKIDTIKRKERVHFTLLPHLFRQIDKQN